MKFELSQQFYFDAAHRLSTEINPDQSAQIHGHTYFVEVFLTGEVNASNGMILDLGIVRDYTHRIREKLDHKLLNDIPNLDRPTMENLCLFIMMFFKENKITLSKVTIWRKGIGDRCTIFNE